MNFPQSMSFNTRCL